MEIHENDKYLNKNTFQQLLSQNHEFDWMKKIRKQAFEEYMDLPWPTSTDDAWRRTKISHIDFENFQAENGFKTNNSSIDKVNDLNDLSGEMQYVSTNLIDGRVLNSTVDKGVIFTTLSNAVKHYPELVSQYLGHNNFPESYHKFSNLNFSFWSHGIFLYIPEFVEIKKPFRALFDEYGDKKVSFPHLIIVLEKGAKASFQQEIYSTGQNETFRNSIVNLFVKDGANLEYTELQLLNENSYNFSNNYTVVEKDASLNLLNANLGSKLTKSYLSGNLNGTGANARLNGIYFADNRQHLDFETSQNHEAPRATSNLLYKGVVKDRAHAIYQGMIKVFPDAQLTDAYQTNRNLLLNDHAKADSIPSLEIEANDVKCSHGSTVGKINDEEIFYLMSRGLSRKDAKRMLISGFFEDTFALTSYNVKTLLMKNIEKKLESLD